jgi:hypothetical protein
MHLFQMPRSTQRGITLPPAMLPAVKRAMASNAPPSLYLR